MRVLYGAMWVVGLMSGTSADAIDVAIVDWPESARARPFELIAYREFPHPESLQSEIHRLAAGELAASEMLAELVRLDALIGERSADAVLALFAETGITPERIAGIASHGQTVAHHPEHGGSLQIGCPARLAERTGCPVIADFRRRDLAMGGEGAPLAPFFHYSVFASAQESRGVLNLGGIANLTWLPAGGASSDVVAFDVGPANALVDAVLALETGGRERFDRDGARARAGRPVAHWLEELLADPYLDRPPPKSTGRERYGLAEARQLLERARRESVSLDDLVATLVSASTGAIARAWRDLTAEGSSRSAGRLLVGGGGVHNAAVMDSLANELEGVIVEPMDRAGVPADAAEAMAFSLMGRNALLGLPNQLPQCTGVAEARVLGVIHPAPARLRD
jgi:anhydro-N-acetylmuramic acid kinase